MKITELCIKSFGKLSNMKITPVDGVNIFYGENEAGKSTIMAFILAMFYGLGKGEQRRRYEPWDGGRISGSIGFEHDGKEYSLRRQFGATRVADKTELWCTTTGEQIELPEHTEPGDHIIGVNRETFVNSVYIGQAGVPIKGENREILAKLTNLAASGDETASRTEIAERLSEAAAGLRSRRSGAILPSLEKKRSALREQKAEIVKRTEQADALREEVVSLTERKAQLESQLGKVEKHSQLLSEVRDLRELEAVLQRRKTYEAAKSEYETIHERIFPEGGGLTAEFIEQSHDLLDEYKQQQVVIKLKEEQLERSEEKIRAVDTSPLKKMRVLKHHGDEIKNARDEYAELKKKYDELSSEIESMEEQETDGKLKLQNVIIICALVVVMFILLGFIHGAFFIVAAIVAALAGAYIYIQKKGVNFEVLPVDNIELSNIISDMREVNRRMKPVLDEMGVPNMDVLDRELYMIRDVRDRKAAVERERDGVAAELDDEKQKLSGILSRLKEKLAPFKAVESDSEALKIVSALEKMLNRHDELEERYKSEKEAYTSALDGRDISDIDRQAQVLRVQLGSRSETDDKNIERYAESIEKFRADLDQTREELASKQTELGLMNNDPQELSRIEDEITSLNERIEHYEFELSAIEEAKSALDEAFESMQKDFGPMLNEKAGKIMTELTGGKYTSVNISDELYPSVAEPGGSIQRVHSLSGGTIDQIYLALRLALAGVLSEERLPLLLDDAFAQYDDKRMTEALTYLGEECDGDSIGQILMFTCHERVLTAAENCGLGEGIIRMS